MRTLSAWPAPLALALAFTLAACQGQAPEPPAAPEAPAAESQPATLSDFSQPMLARGTEPFWAVQIEGTELTLKRPSEPDVVFQAPGATIVPGKAVWQAKAADGRTMRLSLYVSDCSDGMSELRYPMAAEVEISGSETLRGCAGKASELTREGGV